MPVTPGALARALDETHRRYTDFADAGARWTDHLFQGHFASVGLEDDHPMAADPFEARAAEANTCTVVRANERDFAGIAVFNPTKGQLND